jgi:drug/metabolite transporter (DMT)-like permease
MARPGGAISGAIVMVATTFTMAFGDALVKSLSADFSAWQIFVLRSLVAIPAIIVLLRFRSIPILPRFPLWATLRSGLLIVMWITFYAALPTLDLSTIAAAYYTGPLFITLFSAVLIGEPVGVRRLVAVVVGFAGVVIILRPGSDAFTWTALLPIASAVFYALAAVVTRSRCAGEQPFVLSLALNIAFLLTGCAATIAVELWSSELPAALGSPFVFGSWRPVGAREAALIVLMAAVIVAVSAGIAMAYQSGPPALIATFDYCYLPFAVLWGYALFADVPDGPTMGGIVMIGGAGLLAITTPLRRQASPTT